MRYDHPAFLDVYLEVLTLVNENSNIIVRGYWYLKRNDACLGAQTMVIDRERWNKFVKECRKCPI